ncbi:NAD-dependent DNA ligase LigA [candidate division WOR-3 bacterium]|nr:NAD-dependent DNA ligase LigA [candidate division WOR-3 bacterium]
MLKDPFSEIESLKESIRKRDYEYYVMDKPTISDEEYDKLFQRLKILESENPHLRTTDSPTQRIGEKLSGKFKTIRHKIPMLSLDNTYTYDEIRDFDRKARDALSVVQIDYVIEPKIDGAAVSVIYKNGIFEAGVTRGDGEEGDDISANIKTVKSLPLRLKNHLEAPAELEIRGEVYMRHTVLNMINRERDECNQELFANTRNAASGSLKNLDPSVTASRELDIMFHTVFGETWIKHSLAVEFLHTCGLPVFFPSVVKKNVSEVIEECESWKKRRKDLGYDVDGLVIKIDDLSQRKILGQTMRSPKWAIAYKFPTERTKTKIIGISVQVGRTGFLTPVALMEPVKLKGTVISRASLYNADEIERLGIRPGDEVLIEKGGEIIPKVVEVLVHQDDSKPFAMPEKCPACGSAVVHYEGETAYRCISPACPAQLKAKILHFASRQAMDISGIGDKLTEKLIESDLLKDPGDLYFIREEDLSTIERMGSKSSLNLLSSIDKSKSRPLHKLFYALGIPNVGVKTAKNLSEKFTSVEGLSSASIEEFAEIPEIGPVVAKSISDYFGLDQTSAMLCKLEKAGVKMSGEKNRLRGDSLRGLVFVITGTLSMPREEIKSIIENNGGEVSSFVSSKTNYLIAGESWGSKLEKAKILGVKIIGENELFNFIQKQTV